MICPEGVSRSGIVSDDDALQMNAIARDLYASLRSAPSFRYALVGVEVDSFRTESELDDDLVSRGIDGLVISDAIWDRLGRPERFVRFRPGYYWREFVTVH